MNVGKDPFPRDEVTGLAAFEHLEPVGTVSVISEKSRETAAVNDAAAIGGEDTLPKALPSSNGNAEREPITRPRADATLPLDLSAMTAMQPWGSAAVAPVAADVLDEDTAEDEAEPDEVSTKPKSALDALFDKSAGLANLDWDDEDEATRVHSRPAGRSQSEDGSLDVDWDDEEPPTEMLPFALLDAPPIAARIDADQASNAPAWNNVAEDKTSQYPGTRGSTSIRSATPTIRTTTPPLHLHNTLPPQQLGAKALSGGRPSPFPATLISPALPPGVAESGEDFEDDDDYDSAFKNLMPLPAPELPAPAPQRVVTPVRRVTTPVPASSEPARVAPVEEAVSETPARFIDALKAGHHPSVIIAAGGVLGLVALVLITRAIALSTNIGTAVLEVSPADAQVLVDGKSAAGTGSPYTVSELKAGSHELTAKKRGYNDYHGSFVVSAGQSTKPPVIELAPNLLDVGFSVRSMPPGATVWLDGERTEALTPAKLTGIKPGIHRLALKREGFADYELQMFVPEATVLQLPAAELVAVGGAEPDAASIAKRRGRGSRAEDPEARKRTAHTYGVGDSHETLTSVSARHASAGYGSRGARRDPDDDVAASAPAKAAAADGGKTGTLRLNSRPWSQVSVDGRQVGNTPQANLQLSAGKHKLLLTNPQLGINKNVTVTIKAGETLTQVVNLAE